MPTALLWGGPEVSKRPGPALPVRLPFVTELEVRAADVNAGGHLGHDRAVGLLHEARLRLLASCGVEEAGGAGPGLILLALTVAYHAEAFWGERLRAELGVLSLGRSRLALGYRLARAGQPVLTARTEMAFFDYRGRRPARAPAAIAEALRRYAAHSGD